MNNFPQLHQHDTVSYFSWGILKHANPVKIGQTVVTLNNGKWIFKESIYAVNGTVIVPRGTMD